MSIRFEKLSYTYSSGTSFAYAALKDVDLEIEEGKVTAIIGKTGSGKTTLVQHLNALLLPTSGKLEILGRTISAQEKPQHLKSLRKDVGLVFQFPEYQLFEETILKDIAFGPKNFGVSEEEAVRRAREVIKVVGLEEAMLERSPLDLSGGQKRRVAIAGILAMDPQVLVLDEPTAGLDPQGAQSMMQLFMNLNKQMHKTVLIVTHDMEHVLNYCDNVVVVDNGEILQKTTVQEFFRKTDLLKQLNILPPAIIRTREMLNQRGFHLSEEIMDIKTLAKAIQREVKTK
ncbi:energy-coupling factor transporter ATPase [Holdemania massiliensis]|uniref:Energy-coupling factor transporter ATP-binding protein EcfA2 n=1 Tax=Holdemania massiliensis TaxID=1468449 RepID=A0A6N7S700_9FIRM|nr:energy-coupling factor transporter ATPase [Holdemania massiliensis]MSA71392.1 energy-coupling factor transporter ATPase [Holdemania massiliensis]MSA89641.1 energy-coupling factor transporter ATPase [Holdemania massiliensis]MSB78472.1 energy-coupling factor transporter ATPase [Holdemania massiliensis]MSC33396.1 energy-coupling factor transporter ATPase [Holdemania massiliensis]MSC39787.1 energy-coupling factor transporter ATPase [Holdemania massiliensis]